jgi:RimJ/RimL family protein N-acetyltransferase
MTNTIRFETERLILRQMTEEDTDAMLLVFSDPKVMKYFGGVIFDRPRMEKWVAENLEHHQEHGFSLWSVVLKETGEVIGDCGLETDTIEGELKVGLGFDFQSKYWNQGYATEAAKAALAHGFATYGLDKIYGWIDPENKASQRVAEKAGMKVEKMVDRGGKKYALVAIEKPT